MLPTPISRRHLFTLAAGALGAAALSGSVLAQAPRLRLMVGMPGGNGVDLMARELMRLVQVAEPTLTIEVENMAGSSGRAVFKALTEASGNAGLLGMIQTGLFYSAVADEGDALDKLRTLTIIGALGSDERVLFATKASGLTSWKDLMASTQPLIMPTFNATSAPTVDSLLVNALTGARIRPVPGFNAADRKLALINGEVNVLVATMSGNEDLIEDGTLVPLLRLNSVSATEASPLPTLREVSASPDAEILCRLIDQVSRLREVIMAPAGLADADVARLSAQIEAAARQLVPNKVADYLEDDIVWHKRQEVVEDLGAVIQMANLGAIVRKALQCGQTFAEGGSCA